MIAAWWRKSTLVDSFRLEQCVQVLQEYEFDFYSQNGSPDGDAALHMLVWMDFGFGALL